MSQTQTALAASPPDPLVAAPVSAVSASVTPVSIMPVTATHTGVRCPRCERVSLDLSYCEHCQSELPAQTIVQTSGSGLPPGCWPQGSGAVRPEWSLAALSVGWPEDPSRSFEVRVGSSAFRVRAIRPELWPDLAPDVRSRQAITLSVLPPVHVIELQGGALVAAECWLTSGGINTNPQRERGRSHAGHPDALAHAAGDFPDIEPVSEKGSASATSMNAASLGIDALLDETLRECRLLNVVLTDLHASGYVWLEFDPQAIEVCASLVRVTNLDWRLFPVGQCPSRLARVSPQYSPSEVCRFHDDWIGPRTDVYHLALFVYYRLAGLWPGGFAGRGLEAFGFEVPPLRVFRPDLPVGLWPILRRALSINVAHRPATTSELLDELERTAVSATCLSGERVARQLEIARLASFNRVGNAPRVDGRNDLECRSTRGALPTRLNDRTEQSEVVRPQSYHLDLGWLTSTGQAKSALGAVNQDQGIVVSETVHSREVRLMIVADGVTHARVGAGERASGLACEVLLASIRSQLASLVESAEPTWPTVLDLACVSASEAIVRDALSLPDRPVPMRDNDLMSTTALIGVLDGDELHLANVGDSRAYLVANGIAEQLTVDGDVAMSQLALGTPPEQVQELGAAGKALRCCLGACGETASGELVADAARARPQISRWQLRPGDAIVLCSDGLVEERVFLEPEDLAAIIEGQRDLTSQQLADNLVAAADARQRLPSPTEPNGYGDNITCVVLRFVEGPSPRAAAPEKKL